MKRLAFLHRTRMHLSRVELSRFVVRSRVPKASCIALMRADKRAARRGVVA